MGQPSFAASNAIIYLTYGVFLYVKTPVQRQPLTQYANSSSFMGTGIAWKLRNQAKTDFLSSNGTQTGQDSSQDMIHLCCEHGNELDIR